MLMLWKKSGFFVRSKEFSGLGIGTQPGCFMVRKWKIMTLGTIYCALILLMTHPRVVFIFQEEYSPSQAPWRPCPTTRCPNLAGCCTSAEIKDQFSRITDQLPARCDMLYAAEEKNVNYNWKHKGLCISHTLVFFSDEWESTWNKYTNTRISNSTWYRMHSRSSLIQFSCCFCCFLVEGFNW